MNLITVYFTIGYSFSAEILEIYDLKRAVSSLDDYYTESIHALQRALSSFADVTVKDDELSAAAEYILRSVCWEVDSVAAAVIEKTINSTSVQADVSSKETSEKSVAVKATPLVYIYVGGRRDLSEIRVSARIVAYATHQNGGVPSSKKTSRTSESDAEGDAAYFVYYRHFEIDKNQFSAAWSGGRPSKASPESGKDKGRGGVGGRAPAPPPLLAKAITDSKSLQTQIQLFLVGELGDDSRSRLMEKVLASERSDAGADGKEGKAEERGGDAASDSDIGDQSWVKSGSRGIEPNIHVDSKLWNGSYLTQVHAWGLDTYGNLGLGLDAGDSSKGVSSSLDPQLPRALTLPRGLAVQRVRMLACSTRHTLLLTATGSLFACGENSEGALGLGDLFSRSRFEAVEAFSAEGQPIKLVQVAAGSTSLGSHSMAVSLEGVLYGWGEGHLSGQGTLVNVTVPSPVELPDDEPEAEGEVSSNHRSAAVEVACGGGFTVCVTARGSVYSWGLWSHGRLGEWIRTMPRPGDS